MQLFRIKPERLELPAPLGRWITEPLDTNAAGQAAFYGCFDKIGSEEGERDVGGTATRSPRLTSAHAGVAPKMV